jgi:hypothetical protein
VLDSARACVLLGASLVLACHEGQVRPGAHAVDHGEACAESDCAPEVPMTGQVSPLFAELDTAMRQFVKFRCVGAGVLSVSLRGRRIYKRGFGRMAGPAAEDMPGCNDGAMAGLDPFHASAAPVLPDTPIRLGSVSKFLTASMVRGLVAARIAERGLQATYPTPSHARLADPALGLLPARLLDAIAGTACGPVTVEDDVTPPCERTCGDAGVDVRWRDVTIGDLLAHTAGLPGSAASWDDFVVPHFGALRGFGGEADWAAEDAALRARYPEFRGDIERTRKRLGKGVGPGEKVYFVSRYDRDDSDPQLEWMSVLFTRCLKRAPRGATDDGAYKGPYSNTDSAILDSVVAHLGASGRYAAEVGHPEQHADSQLATFLAANGVEGGVVSAEGIFHNPYAFGEASLEIMPALRTWTDHDGIYATRDWDKKRPYCVWSGEDCDFTAWLEQPSTRPRWDFAVGAGAVASPLASQALTTGTGALSAEAPALLRLLHTYALGDDDIIQGRLRADCGADCNFVMDKAGSLGGGRAYAISVYGGTRSLRLPGLAPDGRVSELGPRLDITLTEPDAVDIVVMVAQNDDGRNEGTVEYSDIDEMIRYALSRLDWAAIEAEVAAQATQVVGLAVDDSGGAIYWCADDRVTIRGGEPRGLGEGELVSHDAYRLPSTRIGVDVVAVARALDRPGMGVYAWYDDGHVGRGAVHDLRGDARPLPYLPAAGRTYRDLVSVVITAEGEAMALYGDGMTSFGTITDLGAHGTGTWGGPDAAGVEALALAPDGRLFVLGSGGTIVVTGLDAFVRDDG